MSEKDEYKYVTLGLSNESSEKSGTCSQEAANFYANPNDILYCKESFEDCVAEVNSGKADRLIVPAAYPKLNQIYFENIGILSVVDFFMFRTPNFVLARKDPSALDYSHLLLASHAAPQPLTKQVEKILPNHQIEVIIAKSNAHAAKMAAESIVHLCITNKIAADLYGLDIVHTFGSADMVWLVWERTNKSH